MMADDFVMEFPYARPGMKPRIEGRAGVVTYLASVMGAVSIDSIENVTVHETRRPRGGDRRGVLRVMAGP